MLELLKTKVTLRNPKSLLYGGSQTRIHCMEKNPKPKKPGDLIDYCMGAIV